MSDNIGGLMAVIFIIVVTACMALAFGIGRASQEAYFHKNWKCSQSAIVDGYAECVEYKKAEEE